MSWEDTFGSWSQPPSQTEQEKCENAERAIKRAIRGSISGLSDYEEYQTRSSYMD